MPVEEPIAIVGVSCEFPSGPHSSRNLDAESYWRFLMAGKTAYERIPDDRFRPDAWKGKGPGRIVTDTAGIMKDADKFDALQFHVSPADARAMTVSTRKLIELSFLALLDAGILYRGRNVGVYAAGISYDSLANSGHDEFEAAGSVAGYPNAIANRISYALDLRGPSIPIDNACSSTLTALHLAIQGIRTGDCESAIVAGCQYNSRIDEFIQLSQAQVLSPDGRCKPFDANADGFGKSDGAAVIVVKPLSAALRDGDHVYAKILGSALSTNGSAAPVSAPSAPLQQVAIREAYARAGRDLSECDYAELHATGTAVGDPIEANALGEVLGRGPAGEPLVVGSVKGNMGHLENTAFLGSLLKCLHILRDGVIPPQASLSTLNPRILWDKHNIRLPRAGEKLRCRGETPLVSLSSFGIGGTNGHVVVEGFKAGRAPLLSSPANDAPLLLTLGALSPKALQAASAALSEQLAGSGASWADVASLTARLGRQARQCTWRASAVVSLGDLCKGRLPVPDPVLAPRQPKPLVFVFSGQGPQHAAMGRCLYARFSTFRTTVQDLDVVHSNLTGVSLLTDVGLFAPENASKAHTLDAGIWPARYIFPALAMLQIALYDTLVEALGRKPDAVVGHSAGETAALYASGAASKELAMTIAVLRGKHMSKTEDLDASMLALACDEHIARELVEDGASIAAYNSTAGVALSGTRAALQRVLERATARGIWARMLRTNVPSHSPLMDVCRDDFLAEASEALHSRGCRAPTLPTYSTVTGKATTAAYDADYLWRNIRQPVLFRQAIAAIDAERPGATFVELSPHPVLLSYVAESAPGSTGLATMRRPAKDGRRLETASLLETIGQLCVEGHGEVRHEALVWDMDAQASRSVLPALPYPFERQSFPIFADDASHHRKFYKPVGPLCHPRLRINRHTHPLMAQHVVQGEAIVPAAAFLEMALEFGATTLYRCSFASMLSLESERPATVQVRLDGAKWSIKTQSPSALRRQSGDSVVTGGASFDVLHAEGFLSREPVSETSPRVDLEALSSTLTACDVKTLYTRGWDHSMSYGPAFRRLQSMSADESNVVAIVKGVRDDIELEEGYRTHPAVIDSALHPLLYFVVGRDGCAAPPPSYYLPSGVARVTVHPAFATFDQTQDIVAWSRLTAWRLDAFEADLKLLSTEGDVLVSLDSLVLSRHESAGAEARAAHDVVWSKVARIDVTSSARLDVGRVSSRAPADGIERLVTTLLGMVGPSSRILEIGCGEGDLSRRACAALASQESIAAYVISDEVGQRAASAHSSTEYAYASALSLDLAAPLAGQGVEQGSFDVVVANQVATEPSCLTSETALSAVRSLLSPQGHLLVLRSSDEGDETKRDQLATFGLRCIARGPAGSHELLVLRKEPSGVTPGTPPSFPFTIGKEMELRDHIDARSADAGRLWLTTVDSIDFGAALGIARCLRAERPDVDLGVAGFPAWWANDTDRLTSTLAWLASDDGFCGVEVEVDEAGNLRVPCLAQQENDDDISASSAPSDDAAIQVTWSRDSLELRAGSGHEAGLASIPRPDSADWPPTRGIVGLAAMARILQPWRHSLQAAVGSQLDRPRILIIDDGSREAQAALWTLDRLDIDGLPHSVLRIGQDTPLDMSSVWSAADDAPFDAVVAASFEPETAQLAEAVLLARGGRLYEWDRVDAGLALDISLRPQHVEADLVDLLSRVGWPAGSEDSMPATPVLGPTVPSADLFRPDAAYVLLGGVGGLGVELARWMALRGARHIVLTSRSGAKRIAGPSDEAVRARRTLHAIRSELDVRVDFVASDAANEAAVRSLFANLANADVSVAGVLVMPVVLDDRLFADQTSESFASLYKVKLDPLRHVLAVCPVESLEFLVFFSSVAAFLGNPGQSNYVAANIAGETMLRPYCNAFAMAVPGISDVGVLARGLQGSTSASRLGELQRLSMTSEAFFVAFGDALRRSRSRHISLYLPPLDWPATSSLLARSGMALPTRCSALLGRQSCSGSEGTAADADGALARLAPLIKQVVGVDPSDADYDAHLPFAAYGLDSLAATRLSAAIKSATGVTVSQIKLLGGLSPAGLEVLVLESQAGGADMEAVARELGAGTDDSALVKIRDGQGTPLVLLHDGGGGVQLFNYVDAELTAPLWAIQVTDDVPYDGDLLQVAQHYLDLLEASGEFTEPLRLGAFSASTSIALAMARLVEARGAPLAQLALIDNSPTLLAAPHLVATTRAEAMARGDHVVAALDAVARSNELDAGEDQGKQRFAAALRQEAERRRAGAGTEATPADSFLSNFCRRLTQSSEIVIKAALRMSEGRRAPDGSVDFGPLFTWLGGVRAPVSLYVAERGLLESQGEGFEAERGRYEDFGLRHHLGIAPNVEVIAGVGHYSILAAPELARALDRGVEDAACGA